MMLSQIGSYMIYPYKIFTFFVIILLSCNYLLAQSVGHVSEKSKTDDVGELAISKSGTANFERRVTVGTEDNSVMIADSAKVSSDMASLWNAGIGDSNTGGVWQPNGYGEQKSVVFRGIQDINAESKKYYKPSFQGAARIIGSGGGTKREYNWAVAARYEITPADFKIELKADRDFPSRSQHKFGLLEEGTITVSPFNEQDRDTLFPLKSLTTSDKNGVEIIGLNLDNGTAKFKAGQKEKSVTIKAVAKNNKEVSYSVSITPPTGVRLVWEKDIEFSDNVRGAGFLAKVYIDPKDVSFKYIKVGEDTCDREDGSRNKINILPVEHPSWLSTEIKDENIDTGCRVYCKEAFDVVNVWTFDMSDRSAFFCWHIPWFYAVDNNKYRIKIVPQEMWLLKNREARIKKLGITAERQAPKPN